MTLAALSGAPPTVAATPSGATAATAAQRAATRFERVLLEQLTKELAATAAPAEDEASAATAAYRDLLPGTMADALSAAGGIGLAAALAPAAPSAPSPRPAPASAPSAGPPSTPPRPTGTAS